MNDRVLVEALRSRDPGALTALYDSHAEGIYRYCWSVLKSPDSAQVALRDTLIAAEAHVGALADPDRLRGWLYALARQECLRRRSAAVADDATETLVAVPAVAAADADLRIMAWNAVRALTDAESELLELTARHELSTFDVAAVLGVTPRQVETAHESARDRLGDAITAEVLARKGPYDCAQRAAILSGFAGELTAEMREEVVTHLPRCETCASHRAGQVSTAKVFELLPTVVLPETLRVRVMSCFVDPELLPYRRYVARRSAALDAEGFPQSGDGRGRRWSQALAGALAAVATVAAIGMIFSYFGHDGDGLTGIASGAFPATGEPPGIRLPWLPDPHETPITVEPILDSSATYPIGAYRSTAPVTVTTPDVVPTRRDLPVPVPTRTGPGPAPTGPGEPSQTLSPGETQGPKPPRDHHGSPTKSPCPTKKPTPRPTVTGTPTATPTPHPEPTPSPTPTATPTDPPKPEPTPTPPPTETAPTKDPQQGSDGGSTAPGGGSGGDSAQGGSGGGSGDGTGGGGAGTPSDVGAQEPPVLAESSTQENA